MIKTEADAKKIIERFAKEQRAGRYACPRCGMWKMADSVLRNALSRAADVYVCDDCGMDEAVRAMAKNPLPLTEWALVQDVRGESCEEYPLEPSQSRCNSR